MAEAPASAYPIETLVLEDFTRTPNTSAGLYQTVLEHVVPRNEVRALLRYPGRLTFGTQDAFVGDGAAKSFALLSTLVQSRNFPTPARAFKGATGGGVAGATELTYTSAAAPGAGEFTISAANAIVLAAADDAPTAGETVWVYYAFADGEYTIEVFTPNERRHDTYANGTIRRLNAAPQDDVNSVFAIGSNTPWLPQDTLIRVQVKVEDADSIVNFDAHNIYTNIELPFTRQPIGAVKDPDNQLSGLGA